MANQIACQLVPTQGQQPCTRKFVKAVGHFLHGKWFCSPACADKDPEVKKIKEMLEKKERGEDIVPKNTEEEIDDVDLEGTGEVDL